MAKNKEKDYLPLAWCKKMDFQIKASIGDISAEELLSFINASSTHEIAPLLHKYPLLNQVINMSDKYDKMDMGLKSKNEYLREIFSDFDAVFNIKTWAKNKQVYKFDSDFTNELIRTDNNIMTKDMFDYLPFNSFYVDLSDNQELIDDIFCNGFFVYVEKQILATGEVYKLHICKVTDDLFFNNYYIVPNVTGDRGTFRDSDVGELNIYSSSDMKSIDHHYKKTFDAKAFESLVFQILSYLSSVEPDIRENEISKKTYRKPNPNFAPKHKFSEIQTHDVGVVYGSAFRKWKADNTKTERVMSDSEKGYGAGVKKRPHARRAHWSHYWYGKRDSDERYCRPKWVEATFVGIEKGTQSPAVIHKVKGDILSHL